MFWVLHEFWGLIASTGFRKHSSVTLLLAQENQGYYLAPSVICGAVGIMSTAYTELLFSLMFQGEGSRFCGSEELQVLVLARKQDLTPRAK
jgi:hypothetical protein